MGTVKTESPQAGQSRLAIDSFRGGGGEGRACAMVRAAILGGLGGLLFKRGLCALGVVQGKLGRRPT